LGSGARTLPWREGRYRKGSNRALLDVIGETMAWTLLRRQSDGHDWRDNGRTIALENTPKKILFFLLSMKMGTAWDGIYRRKILRTGVMSEVRPLDAFGTAVPQLA
jgi:hypothetical protein